MTPETREELARAMARANGDNPDAMTPTNGGGENAIWQDFAEYADAIASIIERLVAERVAAETERCANALRPALFPTDYNYKQALAAIRSATR